MRALYTLMLWLLMPYAIFRLAWRARKQPEYLRHVRERFGTYAVRCDKPVIWLHAVSVGETRATEGLVKKLRLTFPEHQILFTHTTPTGRSAGEQLFGDSVKRVYLPYDYPFAIRNFLNHFQPELGILMETEIWFNLIHLCRVKGIPLLLLNARMSERSARGYQRLGSLTRDALSELAGIAAQTEQDAVRLTRLGGRTVEVMGNLKFDIEPPAGMLELGIVLRKRFGTQRKVFLAASTREGEESLILDAFEKIETPELLLVIVPRHPQRFDSVAALLEHRGLSFQRRSDERDVGRDTRVMLGDSMGEMFGYYAAADLAFIGGSILPFGGQNLIEACSVGTPVIVGPYTYNFAEATRLAVESGAALQVQDHAGLTQTIQELFESPDALTKMHHECEGFVKANRGATERSLEHILKVLKRP